MTDYLPFEEEWISENISIRTFKDSSDSEELKWHFDMEDRIIESIKDTDWMFQCDNKLPQKIKGKILIKKGEWHRLIKGTEDLVLKITRS
jgi:hypothetical protein